MKIDILNMNTINEIKAMIGSDRSELLSKIIESFLEDTPHQIEAIEAAIASKDAHALHETAHRLKSSSISVGADKLANECFEIEFLGKSGHVSDPRVSTKAIKLAFEEVIPFFKQFL